MPSAAQSSRAQILHDAEQAVRYDPLRLYLETERHLELERVARAVLIARDLGTCEAILRGEPVPRSALDPEWAKAYGL